MLWPKIWYALRMRGPVRVRKGVQAGKMRIMEKRREAKEKTNSMTMRYLSTEIESVISQAKSQITQLEETLFQQNGGSLPRLAPSGTIP